MARGVVPLTNTKINSLKPKEKVKAYADGNGLYLKHEPTGTKWWQLVYARPFCGRRANMSLGRYPDLTLAGARLEAANCRSLLAQDIDPKAHREEQKRENLKERKNTLAVVANELIESKRLKVKKETADTMQLRFDKHLLAKLGDIPLSKIDVRDVELTLRPLVNEGKLETVKRLSTFINEVMRYAFIRRIIPFNHLADISKLFPSPNVRHSPTIPCKELPDFLETLSNANIRPLTRLLILWQLHTMTRPKEAATARWDEIDIESREWVIPAEKMKMKKEHTVYLSDEVIALLREIKDLNTNREYLFPGYRNPRTHVNSEAANTALKRMGYKDRMVAHGMRALSSTTLYESGKFRSEVIEQSLAHAENNEVKAAYNRAKYEVERRELMAWWGKHIQSASLGDMAVVSLDDWRVGNG